MRIYKTIIFACGSVWVRNLFSDIKEETYTESVWKQDAEPKRGEVTAEWRKLHNEELHDLYSSPSIIRMIKSRWAGHVVRMGENRNMYRLLRGKPEERDH
jgi:hypothetical protein